MTSESIDDRLTYYQVGADVFFAKPVDFRENTAVLNNAFGCIISNSVGTSDCRMLPSERAVQSFLNNESITRWRLLNDGWSLVSSHGDSVDLTLGEFKFLLKLSRSPAIAVSRKDLLQTLEYQHSAYSNRALESLVHRFRSKISVLGTVSVKTAHGIGYSFAASITILWCCIHVMYV